MAAQGRQPPALSAANWPHGELRAIPSGPHGDGIPTPRNMLNTARFIFVVVVFFGSWLEAVRWLSGWKDLESYASSRGTSNERQISNGPYRWVPCRIRWTALTVAVELYPQHLWLRPSFPLNLRCPAISIPWDAIDASHGETFITRTVTLHIYGCSTALRFCGVVGQRILAEVETQRARRATPSRNCVCISSGHRQLK